MKDELNILFASDFSQSSRAALRNLKSLKEKFHTTIELIHVIPSFWKNWIASGQPENEAKHRLEAWQIELMGESDPDKLFVELGNRAEMILSRAEIIEADLIVLGSKDQGPKKRYTSAATVEGVVVNAKQSTLVCKNETISKILCGVDGSASSAVALEWAMTLARKYNARLTILSVISKVHGDVLGMEEEKVEQEKKHIEEEHSMRIDKFLKEFDFSDLEVEKQCRWGVPAHALLDTAEDFDYDMIVVGAKGHNVLHHVLVGSTAKKVLRFTPCSLLVVR